MPLVVLIVWLVAASVGVYLLYLWLRGGGLRQQATKVTRFPKALIFSHPLLAVTGLGLWAAFMVTRTGAYAWGSFGALCVVALLGFVMFTRWLGGGRHARGAENHFPVVAVGLHGLAGVSTFVLVLLTAAELTR
ncbi:hypothetical protein FDA94_19450 [Herbidospora galbida]|uniref:DUF4079 domain-containing protein n=1 Tax=Herbidospora galbida TaxID=2575442 RepID=A0A4U3MGL3_9ACTN|nr:hypothetical protein [Herbidospora galbida]TKK86966.1 hypothetical protein FDA94_19450 [Herbidospora galbida]